MKYTYIYNSQHSSNELVVISHGVSEDIRSDFLTKISNKAYSKNKDTLLIQLPYMDRGESKSSSKELTEEVESVQSILGSIDTAQYSKIHFVGKSLGGLVFLNHIYRNMSTTSQTIELTFLGYLVEFTRLENRNDFNINIIQGSIDKYGTKEQVLEVIKNHPDLSIKAEFIEDADHSYRNVDKAPVYQDQAIDLIKF